MKFTKTLLVSPLIAGSLISINFAAIDSKSEISYSVGYTMGTTLQSQMQQNNVYADELQIVDGLKDGLNAKKSKLTTEEMQNSMLEFQNQDIDQKNSQVIEGVKND